jgi:hypothetical protein
MSKPFGIHSVSFDHTYHACELNTKQRYYLNYHRRFPSQFKCAILKPLQFQTITLRTGFLDPVGASVTYMARRIRAELSSQLALLREVVDQNWGDPNFPEHSILKSFRLCKILTH